ncbi:MAG: SusC/RagA family TonB-linked outer membrane protein [Mediterranea sp.]|nr:SusC/RagA family TonB-linked outer membrane protein [Mediterranea sp.]
MALAVHAGLLAQTGSPRITIQKEGIARVEALKEVERQSGLSVEYNHSRLESKGRINLSLDNVTLDEALSKILANSGYTYRITEKYILIVPRSESEKVPGKIVRGQVLDENNEALIGVNVQVKGATTGVITDLDGKFAIEAPTGGTLVVSYIGYITQQVEVGAGTAYRTISMQPESRTLDEVVVTALGIKREQKALSYNVQQVSNNQLTDVKDANFINSLSGKVAGVVVNSSSSGVGGASKVVMRGTKSINQSSNALYVIDGVPMYNFGGGGDKEFGSRGATEGIADLNPEDIESTSVLTGAAAAALYGSSAANGAIIITTRKGKQGKLDVSLSSGIDWLRPFVMPEFQNRYGTGSGGKASNDPSVWSWGTKMERGTGYQPANDFLETGAIYNNSITLTTGTEKNQTFFSAAALNSDGMVPNNRYNRYNFTFRNTTSFLKDKMKLDVGASYILQNDRNMTNQGQFSNPLVSAYLFPRGDDFSTARVFERYDPTRKINVQFWPWGEGDLRMQNPYWIAYRNLRENKKKRYMMSASLSYDILDWLNIAGRVRVDNSSGTYEQKLYASTIATLTDGSDKGHYTIEKEETSQAYADFLVNINKRLSDFSVVANVGASLSDNTYDMLSYRGPIQEKGIPNVFNVFDLDSSKKRARQERWEELTESAFASLELGWKSMIYLTATGRVEWPSQLKGGSPECFAYPSAGLSLVLSEMFALPRWVDYLKVRGAYTSVGNPYPRNLTIPTHPYDETTQTWHPNTIYPLGKYKPERTYSYEGGVDATLFGDLKLSASFYYANTDHQTFDPKISVSSGYANLYVQTGKVRNVGVEGMVSYGHRWNRFAWNTSFTFSWNKNKIIELVRDYVHPETGEVINKSELEMTGLGYTRFILKEGGSMGDLYAYADLARNDKGLIEIDANGDISKNTDVKPFKLGNVFPKANLAWNNEFGYRGISLGFLINCRLGGIVYSATQAALDQYGVSEASALARDNGGVLVNGRTLYDAQKWYSTIGSSSGLPQYYTYSATNIRLQEARIGYTIPRRWLGNTCDINLSLVGRNLWMIYCKAPFDPESVASTDNYYQGIDYFMMPSTRNIGFNVKINF